MKIKAYTTLGWMAWQGFQVVAKRKLGQKKVKLGAGAAVLAVLATVGLVAAKSGSDNS